MRPEQGKPLTADITRYSTLAPATVWRAISKGCFHVETTPHLHTFMGVAGNFFFGGGGTFLENFQKNFLRRL